eukprot:6189453-Pleurochrysis_carterae.AAC.1
MDNNYDAPKRLLYEPWNGTQGAEFVRRFAPQLEAALHTIQYASLYVHLPGTDPGASPANPRPCAAPARTRSQATTPAEDKYIKSERAYNLRSKSFLALYAGMSLTLQFFKRLTPPPSAMAELRGLSFKATVNLHAPAWPTLTTNTNDHCCVSPTSALTSVLLPRSLPRSTRSTLSASQPASTSKMNAGSTSSR